MAHHPAAGSSVDSPRGKSQPSRERPYRGDETLLSRRAPLKGSPGALAGRGRERCAAAAEGWRPKGVRRRRSFLSCLSGGQWLGGSLPLLGGFHGSADVEFGDSLIVKDR